MPRKKPIPIPQRKQAQNHEPAAGEVADLSYIAEGLRPLAVPIGELIFDPANARTHGENSVSAIAASLRVYGQCKPVVARRESGVVIAGNGTLQAALSLGWTHLAAVKVDMDSATAAGYSISDNRTMELSNWDKDALDKLMREVSTNADPILDEMMADLAKSQGLYRTEGDGEPDDPNEHWQGMPEFEHQDLTSIQSIHIHFKTKEDVESFARLIGQAITENTKSLWHPKQEIIRYGEVQSEVSGLHHLEGEMGEPLDEQSA